MKKYVKHITGEMDESGMQRCVICGHIITDYRGAMVQVGSSPLRGFDPGAIYIYENITTIVEPDEEYEICKPK